MKKIITCAMILIVSMQSFSQQISTTTPSLTKADYLQKSKKQETAAWILAGGGVGLVVIGIAITSTNDVANAIVGDVNGLSAGTVLFTLGGITALTSIPLFIASGKNRKRAMTATGFFKMETTPVIQKSSFVQNSFPAFALKIDLK